MTQMINDTDRSHGGAVQFSALLRQILDLEMANSSRSEVVEFLNFFYQKCIHTLIEPIYQISHSARNRIFYGGWVVENLLLGVIL